MPASMTKHAAARDLPPRPSGNACAISLAAPTMGRDVTTRLRDITLIDLDSDRLLFAHIATPPCWHVRCPRAPVSVRCIHDMEIPRDSTDLVRANEST